MKITNQEIVDYFIEEETEIFDAIEAWTKIRLVAGVSNGVVDPADEVLLDRLKFLLARAEDFAPTILNDRKRRDAG